VLILNADDVRQALPMRQAIPAMKSAFAALADGRAEMPLRCRLAVAPHEAVTLAMPAFVNGADGQSLTVKVVSVFPHNTVRGLATVFGVVLLLEADSGRPLALLEGGSLTALRTGAASGVATELLSRPGSEVAAVFGAGVQARTQLEAVCAVRPIRKAWIYSRTPSRAAALAAEMAGQGDIPGDLRVATAAMEAVAEADVVCTATTSSQPVFADTDLKPGVHINAVGAYTPQMREVPGATVRRALVVVDARAAALAEAGDLLIPIREGLIGANHIHAELGEIVLGRQPGRTAEGQVTVFKSVGLAVQDALAATTAYQNARAMGLGHQVPW
jgi:ornithine cyclodeaminase